MSEGPDIADFLAVAAEATGLPVDQFIDATDLGLAESAITAPYASFDGVDFYPDVVQRAAILGARIAQNHALPDGNKRTGLLMMLRELRRVGATWTEPSQDDVAAMFERISGKEPRLTEQEFVAWIAANVA